MDKNLINMKSIDNITRKMLSVIRENNNISSQGIIKEDVDTTNSKLGGKNGLPIKKNTPQFGDVREAQEQSLIKTLGENIEFEENALMYYPENKDLVLTGKINALNLKEKVYFIKFAPISILCTIKPNSYICKKQ